MTTKALLDRDELARRLGERRIWQPDETRRLATLPLTHGYFYWLILRPMCDPVTQRLGENYRVSWDFLSAQFVLWIHKKLDKQQLRRITHKLESVGLIHKIHHPRRLIFHLPFATELTWLESLSIPSDQPFPIPLVTPVSPSMSKENADSRIPSVIPFSIPSGIPPNVQCDTGVPLVIPPYRERNDGKFNTLGVSQWVAMIPLVIHYCEKVCLYLYILIIYILINNNKKAHFKNHPSHLEAPTTSSGQATWFDRFWQLYPVKKSKKRAKALFDRLVRDESDFERIIMAVKAQLTEREALEAQRACGSQVFIPAWKYPTTWLNQGCWDDEVNEAPAWPNQPTQYPTIKRFWANADLSDIDYGGEDYD